MVEIVFTDETGELVQVVIDAVPEEQHRFSAQVTDHEVERGVAISDHMRPEARILTLSIVVAEGSIRPTSDAVSPTRMKDQWATLLYARDHRWLAAIDTALEVYESMVLMEATAPKTVVDAGWLRATLTFKQIRMVSTETVVDPVRARDHRQVNRGAQGTEEASPRLQSLLVQGFDGIFG